jgi:hypothetical protein
LTRGLLPPSKSQFSVPAAILILLAASIIIAQGSRMSTDGLPERFRSQPATQGDYEIQIQPNQFLITRGANATPSVVFTPVNGFVGDLNLTTTINPSGPTSPQVALNVSGLRISYVLRWPISISTANTTEFGLYNITLTGTSGAISHSATATVGVTSGTIPSNGAELIYEGHFNTIAYPGNSTTLISTFEALGYARIGIRSLTVRIDFGIFQNTCIGLTCNDYMVVLNPYDERSYSLTIQVPSNTSIGIHAVTATISWDVGSTPAPDILAHGNLTVYSRPTPQPRPHTITIGELVSNVTNLVKGLALVFAPIVGGVAAFVLLVIGLLHRIERREEETGAGTSIATRTLLSPGTTTRCPSCGSTVFGARYCPRCGQPT